MILQSSNITKMAVIVIWILLSMLHYTVGQNVKTKMFSLHSDSLTSEFLDCILSCMENGCGAVNMTDERCIQYSKTEWHPEMNLDASEKVSGSIC